MLENDHDDSIAVKLLTQQILRPGLVGDGIQGPRTHEITGAVGSWPEGWLSIESLLGKGDVPLKT